MGNTTQNQQPANKESEACEAVHILMSGDLDGELSPEQKAELDAHLAGCAACRSEFDKMRRLVIATSQLRLRQPPDSVFDNFEDGVYNRLERRTGWVVFIIGAAALAVFGAYVFVTESWGNALVKTLIAAPVIGLAIVFWSVLRERIAAAKTDRYSKEVKK